MDTNPYETNADGPSVAEENIATPRKGFRVVELFAVIALIGILIALFLPLERNARNAGRRTQSLNNIRNIMTALHSYHADYGEFPPAFTKDEQGQPLHSWRTLILPYLNEEQLYKQIDLSKPWDDPVNAFVHNSIPSVYKAPTPDLTDGHTIYLGLVGSNAFFSDDGTPRSLDAITDSHDQTIAIAEVAPEDSVHWMAPTKQGLAVFMDTESESRTPYAGGMNVGFAYGGARFISKHLSRDLRLELTTIDGGEQLE